jgi:hypothetical protein
MIEISIPADHAALATDATSSTLHVVSGFFSHPPVWVGFLSLAMTSARGLTERVAEVIRRG